MWTGFRSVPIQVRCNDCTNSNISPAGIGRALGREALNVRVAVPDIGAPRYTLKQYPNANVPSSRTKRRICRLECEPKCVTGPQAAAVEWTGLSRSCCCCDLQPSRRDMRWPPPSWENCARLKVFSSSRSCSQNCCQRLSHFVHASQQALQVCLRDGDVLAVGQLAKLLHQATHIQKVVSWPGWLFGSILRRSFRCGLCLSLGFA